MKYPVVATTYEQYLAEIERFPLLTPKEEFDLAVRWYRHRDIEAAKRLVTSNLRFVVKIALEYKRYGAQLIDLIQEGNIGLMKAVKRFNPYKGYRLISYAVWWIRAQIHAFLMKTWSLVKIGTTQAQRKLFAHRKELATLGSPQDERIQRTTESLAKELKVKDKEVLEMELRLSARDFSLDAPIKGETEGTTYLDQWAHEAPNQETRLVEVDRMKRVRSSIEQAMKKLSPRENEVVERRLLTDPPMTLQKIGEEFHISRERVRQIEASALKKLRASLTLPKELLPAATG